MLTSFKKEIARFLSQEFSKPPEDFYPSIEHPPTLDKGHYTFSCFKLSKLIKKKPNEIAQALAQKFPKTRHIENAVAVGPYLNFFVNKEEYHHEVIGEILNKKENFGSSLMGKKQTIVLEYSSPNIAKPFHVGHFRATIIGHALKKIFEACGYTCIGINYLGDWGTQFGKLITAFKKWGDEKKLSIEPVKYLNSLYVQFHREAQESPSLEDDAREWFKKCEEGDSEARRLWKIFREASLKDFKVIYDLLGVTFDELSGESIYNDIIPKTVSDLKKSGKTKISEGALIIDLQKFNLPPALILRRDGASLYLTRDIAALFDRYQRFKFDKMVYVVGETQSLHFNQLFSVMTIMGADWAKNCYHISFGQIRLKDQQMSTRKGTAILLEDLIDKSRSLISHIIEEKNPSLKGKKEIALQVAIAAIIFADFGSRRIKNVIFDWKLILNPEGDTGPYVLYTYARASSIIRKASPSKEIQPNWALLKSAEEQLLIWHLERFPKIIRLAAHYFEPSYIATYLIELSKLFNRFYHEHRVIQDNEALKATRLKLVAATRQVLQSGLYLLGIRPVEEL